MKKRYLFTGLLLCLLALASTVDAQKTISEGTLTYSISMSAGGVAVNNGLAGATVTVNLKGNLSRTDMVSSLGNEKTIYDAKAGTAVILKEYSGQKLMITLTKDNWQARNKNSQGVEFTLLTDTKEILGYQCNKATAKLSDGSVITVFYAKDLTLMNKDYDPAFKNLPGVPMQYDVEKDNSKFTYSITRIDLNAVPAARFEIPKVGYRVISYDENQQGKKN